MTRRMGWCLVLGMPLASALAGVELSGRLAAPDSDPAVMLAAVRVFGFPEGAAVGNGFRTWEMDPRGWWKLEGEAGDWTVLFTGPAHFMRPCVLSARLDADEKRSGLGPRPRFDVACFSEAAWDPKPARAYWQPFTARSRSVTHVGFKLATDGVDGPGPGSQALVVSVHRCTDGPAESWPQVGPARLAPEVDCGGAKSYHYSVGWHSGEAPMEPGERYAVRLAPAAATS